MTDSRAAAASLVDDSLSGFLLPPAGGSDAADGGGLVTCAITARETPLTAHAVISGGLRFPSGDLVDAAASLFPPASRGSAITGRGRLYKSGERVEFNSDREGPVALVSVAPGMVRLSRFDPARRERALRAVASGTASTRGAVLGWSAKSRARMMIAIRQLDLHAYTAGRIPVMATLTYPGDWLALAPDAVTAAGHFRAFKERFRRRWGAPAWIWKREFQQRGAPHWHLWLVPPTDNLKEFREWLSATWTDVVSPSRVPDEGREHKQNGRGVRCVCSEWCRHLLAGTGVDQAAGMDARDPQRLAVYFLKESHGGESKAYQNEVPDQWCIGWLPDGYSGPLPEARVPRDTVGRFWGVAGLQKSVASVEIDEAVAVKLWRAMSHARRSKMVEPAPVPDCPAVTAAGRLMPARDRVMPITRAVRSLPWWVLEAAPAAVEPAGAHGGGFDVVETPVMRRREFRVKRRPVARVVTSAQQAGWVGANDGPAFASQLARYAGILAGTAEPSSPPWARPLSDAAAMRLRVLRAAFRPAGNSERSELGS